MQDKPIKRPNTIPWPPILFIGALATSWAIRRWLLIPLVPHAETNAARGAGLALMAVGAVLVGWTKREFARHHTTIMPTAAATALVTTGPFAWSRNPNYLGLVLVLIGLALAMGSPASLIVAPIFAIAVDRLAIRREERFLLDRFGDDWADYADRVRRWL